MSSQRRLEMMRPRPVPPLLRVEEVSTWLNGRKRWSSLSAGMPIPESLTAKNSRATRRGEPGSMGSPRAHDTSSETPPRSVNLSALPIRFVSIWRIRGSSLLTISGTPGSTLESSASARERAFGAKSAQTSWTHSRIENGARSMSILPDSILERLSMSAMIFSRARPLELIISTCSRWSRFNVVLESILENPMMALMGVRSSWLTIARNSDFARSAASAASLARNSAASASLRSVMSWPTAWYSEVLRLSSLIALWVQRIQRRLPSSNVISDPLGPADPETPAIIERHLGFERVRFIRDRRARDKIWEIGAHQVVALAIQGAGVGAVDEGDLAIVLVAADEVGLVLDDALVAGLDVLEGARHVLDLASQPDDLVRVRFIARGGDVLGLDGIRRVVERPQRLHECLIPDIARKQQQKASGDRESDDVKIGAEALPELLVGDDGHPRHDEGESKNQKKHGLALHRL